MTEPVNLPSQRPRRPLEGIRRGTPEPIRLPRAAGPKPAPRTPQYIPAPPRRRPRVQPPPIDLRAAGSKPTAHPAAVARARPAAPARPARGLARRSARRTTVPRLTPGSLKAVLSWMQYPLIALGALAAAFNSTAGQLLVVMYAVVALWRRWPAALSFGAALFVLLTIPLFQLLDRAIIAQNAATYVYELLVIGTISAVLELRKSGETDK
ncbi:MAG TPA: hypothetical protein VI322_02990 [Candidatus Saccharimonadia bacterium]